LHNKGLDAHVEKIAHATNFSIPYVHKSVYQAVLDKKFSSEAEAKAYQEAIRSKSNSEIMIIPKTEPQGRIRFTNLDNQYSFDSREPIRLTAAEIDLADVEVGSGFHWETTEHRTYTGAMEFLVDNDGLLTVVNELPLEQYLKGVVPSEMPVSFPYEALKAQSIAARVEAVTKVGLRHPYQPFDLCDEVHCQVFSGITRNAEPSDMAVESTRGIFMIYRKEITEAFYAGVCGGHTENNDNVWLMDAKPYLRGVLDKGGNRLTTPLNTETNVKKWIDSHPNVYCNASRADAPKSVSYSKKYFRWQVAYDRLELERIIKKKTGEDFGRLVDLVPLKRGVSGRLIDLQVVGSRKRFVINKELNIRQALSEKTLFSACFYVKKQGRSGRFAKKFILKGAGWGHGVGMCQIGAAMMANTGQKFDAILTHYYQGVHLEKLYD
ncbi:MAG: SpoIID/LytB domain-containing protein, partial [bacterium]